ncbi:hypothetical protein LTR53_018054, partial [Teratosphaeriaceae sp. CCFEE 6253]
LFIHVDELSDQEKGFTAFVYMADKLYQQLIVAIHGWSEEQYDKQVKENMKAAVDDWCGLSEIFNDPPLPGARSNATQGGIRMVPEERVSPQRGEAGLGGETCFRQRQLLRLWFVRKRAWCHFVLRMRKNFTAEVHVRRQMYHSSDDYGQSISVLSVMFSDVPQSLLDRGHRSSRLQCFMVSQDQLYRSTTPTPSPKHIEWKAGRLQRRAMKHSKP